MFFRRRPIERASSSSSSIEDIVETLYGEIENKASLGKYYELKDVSTLCTLAKELLDDSYVIRDIAVEAYSFDQEHNFLLPRSLSSHCSDSLQVVLLATSNPSSLKLYKRSIENQLLPIPVSIENNAFVLEVQLVAQDVFYAFDTDSDAYLLVALASIDECKFGEDLLPENIFLTVDPSRLAMVRDEFAETSFLEMPCLQPTFLDALVEQLDSLADRIELVGPYDYRYYYQASSIREDTALNRFIDTLSSDRFRCWMHDITGLQLGGIVYYDLKLIKSGCFQIFNNKFEERNGLDVVISLTHVNSHDGCKSDQESDDGGSWIYLVDGEQVATIKPRNGIMSLAYRVEGGSRFLSHVSASSTLVLYQFHLLFKVRED